MEKLSPCTYQITYLKYIEIYTSIAWNCFYQILEKVAEKFAKKSNFSYSEAYDNLSKKEQKLTLDRICRKFLKSDESDTNDKNHTKEKKRAVGSLVPTVAVVAQIQLLS